MLVAKYQTKNYIKVKKESIEKISNVRFHSVNAL